MPQITCPNCGLTINLENRKEIDIDLIKAATRKEPKTFTELMHITRLPRKTLSLRLKALCGTGALVKEAGTYQLNGASEPRKSFYMNFKGGYSRKLDRRMQIGLMMVSLAICFSASGYVLAMLLQPSPQIVLQAEKPIIIGSFAMDLSVNDVQDLYAWQALITFNSSELKVLQTSHGSFIGLDDPLFFWNATSLDDNALLIGGSACAPMPGQSGSGKLATVVFGYYVSNYNPPKIASEAYAEETFLLDSNLSTIPMGEQTKLTFEPVS
jgi:hypothetical protein